ncbi:hypothetical protein DL96DRAFT_1019623 [Flagelloscypha sp. PMI_526]|nr:hypothetical protein DL96DRAFT_1019623 [Flagelloscypha sp. PMI_526]
MPEWTDHFLWRVEPEGHGCLGGRVEDGLELSLRGRAHYYCGSVQIRGCRIIKGLCPSLGKERCGSIRRGGLVSGDLFEYFSIFIGYKSLVIWSLDPTSPTRKQCRSGSKTSSGPFIESLRLSTIFIFPLFSDKTAAVLSRRPTEGVDTTVGQMSCGRIGRYRAVRCTRTKELSRNERVARLSSTWMETTLPPKNRELIEEGSSTVEPWSLSTVYPYPN